VSDLVVLRRAAANLLVEVQFVIDAIVQVGKVLLLLQATTCDSIVSFPHGLNSPTIIENWMTDLASNGLVVPKTFHTATTGQVEVEID
jgi:hypothetical protein